MPVRKGQPRDAVLLTWPVCRSYGGVAAGRTEVRRAAEKRRDSAASISISTRTLRLLRGQSATGVAASAFITQTPEKNSCVLPSAQSEQWGASGGTPRYYLRFVNIDWSCSSSPFLLLSDHIKLLKHPVITFSASKLSILLFQAFAFWTFISEALEEQQSRAWERWNRKAVDSLRTARPVHRSWTAPLHIVRGALDPLTSAHINLAKYRGITAMSA